MTNQDATKIAKELAEVKDKYEVATLLHEHYKKKNEDLAKENSKLMNRIADLKYKLEEKCECSKLQDKVSYLEAELEKKTAILEQLKETLKDID